MDFNNIIFYAALALFVFLLYKRFTAGKGVKHLSQEEIKQQFGKNNFVLLDVRTENERRIKKIDNSIHIPLNDLNRRLSELEKFKEKEIVCYCQSGMRSSSAARMLQKNGFNTTNLKGGISSWRS